MTELETNIVSVERVDEYCHVSQEVREEVSLHEDTQYHNIGLVKQLLDTLKPLHPATTGCYWLSEISKPLEEFTNNHMPFNYKFDYHSYLMLSMYFSD